MSASQEKLRHAREFTDIEDTTLDAWLQAEDANLDERAARILDAGLMLEHFTSLLESDPNKRSIEDVTIQAQLKLKLDDEIRLLRNDLQRIAKEKGKPNPYFPKPE